MIWAVFARNYYICEIKGECGPPLADVDSTFLDNIPETLDLTAGEHILLENYPQFYFDYASHDYTYIDGNEKFLGYVVSFLEEHPADSIYLVITGYYLSSESKAIKNSNLYNDLGMARAQTIIDKLIHEYQLPKGRIQAQSKLAISDPVEEYLSFNIVGYIPPNAIAQTKEDTAFLELIKTSVKDITYTDKSAKFAYNSGVFNPNPTFEVYVDSLRQYFGRNPDDYLVIIGHTDSRGTESYNRELGLERAESVKNYLQEQNLEITIKTKSEGEKNPMVPNKNEDGSYNIDAMAKNRRVNIIIKSTN